MNSQYGNSHLTKESSNPPTTNGFYLLKPYIIFINFQLECICNIGLFHYTNYMNYKQQFSFLIESLLIIVAGYLALNIRAIYLKEILENEMIVSERTWIIVLISIIIHQLIFVYKDNKEIIFLNKNMQIKYLFYEIIIDILIISTFIFFIKEKIFSRAYLFIFIFLKIVLLFFYRRFLSEKINLFFNKKFKGKNNKIVISNINRIKDSDAILTNIIENNISEITLQIKLTELSQIGVLITKLQVIGKSIIIDIIEQDDLYRMTVIDGNKISFNFREYPISLIVFKTVFDIICGFTGSLIAIISYVLFYIPIKIQTNDSVIFCQERIGLHGQKFKMYKFRTMRNIKVNINEENEIDGPAFKMKNDPRITTFGRILRKSSLDELPQFFNVIKGDMSIVGPRPPLHNEVSSYKHAFYKRMSIRPGITGYWQINSRKKTTSFDQIYNDDLYYLKNSNLWLEIKIILFTIKSMVALEGK